MSKFKYVVEIGRGGHEKLVCDCETQKIAEDLLNKYLGYGMNAYLSNTKPNKKHEMYMKIDKNYKIIEEN